MDFWVVLAAAGAGCLTKRLQSTSINKDGLSKLSYEVSSSRDQKLPSSPIRGLAGRKKLERDASTNSGNALNEEIVDISRSDCGSAADWASPYRLDDQASSRDLQEYNASSAASLPADFPTEQTETEDACRTNTDGSNCESSEALSALPPEGEMATFHGSAKRGCSLRSRYLHGQFPKPQSSLESCLMAQLYNHHTEMGGFSRRPLTPPASPNIRPLLVTNGSSIISRCGGASLHEAGARAKKTQKVYSERSGGVMGVPALPKVGHSKMRKKMQNRTLGRKNIHSRSGSPSGTTLLCMGISLGIIFSVLSNKNEVNKLKDLLKQTENLVQDLQEELEMRDSLTVKELISENCESLDTRDNSIHDTAPSMITPEQCIESPTKYDDKDTDVERTGKSPDSMTRIEEELEAELERLGLNIKAANLETRLSDAELDPDFDADFAEGEFRAQRDSRPNKENNRDSSSSTTTHSINYAVSPRELSLRLHEVIQSRLEERIEELELALQNSQRKVQVLESSNSKNGRRSPLIKDIRPSDLHQSSPEPEPLVMNLSGEALSAYNEAYEELVKFESEEDDSPPGIYDFQHQERSEKGQNRAQEIDSAYATGYESSDGDDEKERLLIQQIIERTKKGSPVVVNALLSIDSE